MGMFDTVHFTCPKCGNIISVQSKEGHCILAEYSSDKVPPEIADRMVGISVHCRTCESKYMVDDDQPPRKHVPLFLVEE